MKAHLCARCATLEYIDAPWWRVPEDRRCFSCGAEAHDLYELVHAGTYHTDLEIMEVWAVVPEGIEVATPQETDATEIFDLFN